MPLLLQWENSGIKSPLIPSDGIPDVEGTIGNLTVGELQTDQSLLKQPPIYTKNKGFCQKLIEIKH